MAIYYQFMNVLSGVTGGTGRDPNLKFLEKLSAKDSFSYLMGNPSTTGGEYLGACLDSCRMGSMTTCAWPGNIKDLMGLIETWRAENWDDESLYHEHSIDEFYSKFELPHIRHDECPRDKEHTEKIVMDKGIVRCGRRSVEMMKPSFIEVHSSWDEYSQMRINNMYEEEPNIDSWGNEDGEEWIPEQEYKKYLRDKEIWYSEEPEEVVDVCYAILNDENRILSFEDVLKRLNLQPENRMVYCKGGGLEECKRLHEVPEDRRMFSNFCGGHVEKNDLVEFGFDGWTLAHYFMKWKQQEEKFGFMPPWFSEGNEDWERQRAEVSSRYVRCSD